MGAGDPVKAILALLALVGAVVVLRIRRDARVWEVDEHEATVPMTWSLDPANAITIRYLVGPTGVRSSMN